MLNDEQLLPEREHTKLTAAAGKVEGGPAALAGDVGEPGFWHLTFNAKWSRQVHKTCPAARAHTAQCCPNESLSPDSRAPRAPLRQEGCCLLESPEVRRLRGCAPRSLVQQQQMALAIAGCQQNTPTKRAICTPEPACCCKSQMVLQTCP